MGDWDTEFVDAVHKCSLFLSRWKEPCLNLFDRIVEKKYRWKPYDFPFTCNDEIEYGLFGLILYSHAIFSEADIYHDQPLSLIHLYHAFVYFIYRIVLLEWKEFASDANFDTNGYIDLLVREKVMRPPGLGIGYLSLLIAQNIELNSKLLSEIEISRELTPILPYKKNDKADLIKIAGSEDRLRLALLLTRELGLICHKSSVNLTTLDFCDTLWQFLNYNGTIELDIFTECIFQFEKCLSLWGSCSPQQELDSELESLSNLLSMEPSETSTPAISTRTKSSRTPLSSSSYPEILSQEFIHSSDQEPWISENSLSINPDEDIFAKINLD